MLKQLKQQPIVYNADGVACTIYKTTKPTKSGPKVDWLLEDYFPRAGASTVLSSAWLERPDLYVDKIPGPKRPVQNWIG